MIKIMLLLMLFLSVLFAQRLTLSDAIDKALSTHPDVKRFELQVRKSESLVNLSRADYLPQVNLNAEYNPTKTYIFPRNGTFRTINNNGYNIGASVHQKVWDFKKTLLSINAKNEGISIAKLSLKDAKAYLAYKVKIQYELMLVQRLAMEVRQKDLQAKEALYKQAEALVEQGMKTSADATRFLSSFYIAKDNLAISKASFDKARNSLSLYIHEKIPSDVVLDDSMLSSYDLSDDKKIIESSPSLLALKKEVRKSSLEYKSVKSSHYGSVDFVASYNYLSTLNNYHSTLVGITLDLPLYSGGRISALAQQAQLDKQSALAEYDSKKLALQDEIGSLIIDIKRYEKTILAKQAQLDAAASTTNLLEARYKEGLATYIEVLDSFALKLDAQLGLLSARYEKSSAIHKLQYLEGKIDE